MNSIDIVKLEIDLLVAKYGRERIVQGLAQSTGATLAEIEDAICRYRESQQKKRPARTRSSATDLMEKHRGGDGERANLLTELALRFDSAQLFPTTRAATRFLGGFGWYKASKRARTALAPDLVRALLSLSDRDLQRLLDESTPGRPSDYVELAQAIMGRTSKSAKSSDRVSDTSGRGQSDRH